MSDILKASTNPLCTSATTSWNDSDACNSNYLLDKGTATSFTYWTINAFSSESGGYARNAWCSYVDGSTAIVDSTYARFSLHAPRPVIFLKSDTTLTGLGTKESPFTIVE